MAGEMTWVYTIYPCPAYAQEADMSLREFEDFVYQSTFADTPNPVERWHALRDEQQRYVDWLAGRSRVEIRGPNAEIAFSVQGRKFINSSGRDNMPSGEIFTSPVENSADGWVEFSYPAIHGGREVEGVRLVFENGKVVEATAKKNEAYLLSMLDSDPGARYLGEFAIGTNYGIDRFTKLILFDEKMGGTIHMAVGNSYPESGGVNSSSIHWDMICDVRRDSEIRVDGELLYRNGEFRI
jgi:aminopeptidase